MKTKINKKELRKTINQGYLVLLMCFGIMFIILKAKLELFYIFNFVFGFLGFCLLIGIGLLEIKNATI